jgi:hypothetical protein
MIKFCLNCRNPFELNIERLLDQRYRCLYLGETVGLRARTRRPVARRLVMG